MSIGCRLSDDPLKPWQRWSTSCAPVGYASQAPIREVTWEHAAQLHATLAAMALPGLHINQEILLPERCPPPSEVVEKLEIAPADRVYLILC